MRSFRSRLKWMAVRWLVRRAWGRQLLWAYAIRPVMARTRSFGRELAQLFPIVSSRLG